MPLPGFFEGTEMPNTGWWEALWPDPAAVLLKVGLQPKCDAIDLCAGDGWFTVHIAKIAGYAYAIDIDAAMLAAARDRLAQSGMANCDFITGDAYDVQQLAPRAADFVFMANAFHGVPDRARLATAVRNVLKPGGLFAIVNWHARPREETTVLGEPRGPRTELRIGPGIVKSAVEPCGFRVDKIEEIPPYHYATVFRRTAS
jgi:SAM-dependent methyltransferase